MQVSGKMRPVGSLTSNAPWTPTVIECQQKKKKIAKKAFTYRENSLEMKADQQFDSDIKHRDQNVSLEREKYIPWST